MGFCHLQVKSTYSILKSNIEIHKLVQKAKQLGFQSLALTDFHTMYGTMHFYQACMKENIHPIIGLTVLHTSFEKENGQLIFLAKNMQGYKQLVKLSSYIQLEEKTSISIEEILKATDQTDIHKDVIVILPGRSSLFYQYLAEQNITAAQACYEKLTHHFQHVFIGVHQVHETEQYMQLDEMMNFTYVALNDVRFLEQEESVILPFLEAIDAGVKVSEIEIDESLEGKYLKSEEEMLECFSERKTWINQTMEIAKMCQVHFEFPMVSLPTYPLPERFSSNVTQADYLTQLCLKGAEKRYKKISREIEARLKHELDIIYKMCFENYFLIVWDFMRYARTHGILTGPGRGSAAGSLVAYVLGITDIDPMAYGLLFERFLNPERITMPDIDLDFPDNKRDEVIQYVKEKYGANHVAHIITFGTFGAKQAIRDIGRVMGYTPKELDEFSKRIPSHLNITLEEAYQESTVFQKIINQTKRAQDLLKIAQQIEGLPRHTSIHAAGIIISPIPFGEVVPVQWGPDQILVTQYSADVLEQLGFLKMDFLGLRNLKLIQEVVDQIQKSKQTTFDIRKIPLDDQRTYEIFRKGETNGIFQFESQGMRRALIQLQPTEFNDLVALNALYRPGPMEQISTYVQNKRKQVRDVLHISAITHILAPTYGIIIYQEQIMQIASVMAGFSLAEADLLRRAISKKKKEILDFERTRFVNGSKKNGYTEEIGNKVYDLIVQFANYGFNKSHSVAYSMIAYQLAYLKANHSIEFFVAALSNVMGSEEKTQSYLKEAKSYGISTYPPSVLSGNYKFRFSQNHIILGLGSIKGIGKQLAYQLIDERRKRPFIDFYDFISRMSMCGFGKKIFETLILGGAMDEFGLDRAVLLGNLEPALRYTELVKPFMQGEQMNLFDLAQMVPKPKLDMAKSMTDEEKGRHEKELLGFYLTVDPYQKLKKFMFDSRFILLKELQYTSKYLKRFTVVMIQSIRVIKTKKGEQMAFLVIEDASGVFEAVVFPKVYASIFLQLKLGGFSILQCSPDSSRDKLQYIVHECWPVEMFEQAYLQGDFRLHIHMDCEKGFDEKYRKLLELCRMNPGNTQVVLYEQRNTRISRLLDDRIVLSSEVIEDLIQIFGVHHIVIKK